MLPKTLILGINLHGEIPLNSDEQVFREPLKIDNLITLNAVECGVPNVSTINITSVLSSYIDKFIHEHSLDWLERDYTQGELINYITGINEIILENIEETNKDIINKYIKSKNEDYSSYVNNLDKSNKITPYIKDDIIYNKLFSKVTPDEINNYHHITGEIYTDNELKYFNKIYIYNSNNFNDIFELLDMVGYKFESITLFELIEFVLELGVKNIIMIDFSCSVFTKDGEYLDERSVRTLRREIMTKSAGGKHKKTRRKNKQKTSRRNKKRR